MFNFLLIILENFKENIKFRVVLFINSVGIFDKKFI